MGEIGDCNKVYKKIIEFNYLIYEDNRNINARERYREEWCNRINGNKPKMKKEKIVYDKSYKNITDEFNEIGNFTLNDDDNDGKNDKNKEKTSKNNDDKKSYKNITDEFNEIGNFTLNDDDNDGKNDKKIKKKN